MKPMMNGINATMKKAALAQEPKDYPIKRYGMASAPSPEAGSASRSGDSGGAPAFPPKS